jgi:rsbT co-antagonist protein RsbR
MQKQAEEERMQRLRAEEQRLVIEKESMRKAKMLQALLDNLDLIVWSIDDKGIFTFHEGCGSDAPGVVPTSHVGLNVFEHYPETAGLRRALGGVADHEVSVTGDVAWETWYVPVRAEEHEAWNVIGLSLNVSEAHQAKTELEAKLALIERQQAVIRDLETPIIQVWDRILTLPMVGTVDSRRAARVTDDLLNQVSRTQASFAILDLTGVEVVDTATAGHMLNIISAVRLLGAEGIITGIRPNIAQTIISLGVDLSRVRTFATLRDGLAFAIRRLLERSATANTPFLQSMTNPGMTNPGI